MKFHGIDCVGIFKLPDVATLPAYTQTEDDRRLIRNREDSIVYVGDDATSSWVAIKGDYHPLNGNDALDMTANIMTANEYIGIDDFKIGDRQVIISNGVLQDAGIYVNDTDGPFVVWNQSANGWFVKHAVGGTSQRIATLNDIQSDVDTHESSLGHIPSGGSSGNTLVWDGAGQVRWTDGGGSTDLSSYTWNTHTDRGTFTNNFGKPIWISSFHGQASGHRDRRLYVNGVMVSRHAGYTYYDTAQCYGWVPDGASYQITGSAAGATYCFR